MAKNSLLKSALRVDFLDESQVVREAEWFQRYLAGETIEFYIKGSGSYVIALLFIILYSESSVPLLGSGIKPSKIFTITMAK